MMHLPPVPQNNKDKDSDGRQLRAPDQQNSFATVEAGSRAGDGL